MTRSPADPLSGPAPKEIPLSKAPLVRVLCQVLFSEVLAITRKDFVAGFHEEIRQHYPLFELENRMTLSIGPTGVPHPGQEPVWRFFDASKTWRVSLAPNFFALDTGAYKSRSDFLQKLTAVAKAAATQIKPAFVTRVGVRYVDQIRGEPFNKLDRLLRKEILGAQVAPLNAGLEHSMTQATYKVAEGKLLARWGQLPSGATHDPEMLPPTSGTSWILDLDAVHGMQIASQPFDVDHIEAITQSLATRVYSVFRWAVTDEFLTEYGKTQ